MTYAEVNFLMAEAALKGWAVAGSADGYYKLVYVRQWTSLLTTTAAVRLLMRNSLLSLPTTALVTPTSSVRLQSILRHGFCTSPIPLKHGQTCAVQVILDLNLRLNTVSASSSPAVRKSPFAFAIRFLNHRIIRPAMMKLWTVWAEAIAGTYPCGGTLTNNIKRNYNEFHI